ncbi:MAG: WecB/TagA/CpsF family glycosyltransferase [Thermodesulfobacteriota bacterium]
MKENLTTSNLLGYRISNRGFRGDIAQALQLMQSGRNNRYAACANPHSLVVAANDKVFASALKEADILLPDGIGIILAARILGLPIYQRVAGFEFFQGLNKTLAEEGGARYFFLGSTNDVLERITNKINIEYENISVCGTFSPPFKPDFSEDEKIQMVNAINIAKPDVLWVGMTAPKQEKWIYQNRDKLSVPFIGAIGAVFEFYAGTKKRASRFWCSIGLEWLPRFLHEPVRLWERNMKSAPKFLFWILKEKMQQMKRGMKNDL